jgi:hypothetical protein
MRPLIKVRFQDTSVAEADKICWRGIVKGRKIKMPIGYSRHFDRESKLISAKRRPRKVRRASH